VRRLRGIAPAALVAAVALVACADILGIQDLSNRPPVADAAPPADAGSDVDLRCTADPGPPRPDAGDGTSQPDLLLALDSVDFGKIPDVPGLNLDHVCTVDRDSGSCVSPATVFSAAIDRAGGADNAAYEAFTTGAGALTVATQVAAELKKGNWSLLVRIRSYSGAADDPSVVVQVATGFARSGTTWSVDDVSVDGGLDGAITSSSAWVTGGVLLARFDDFPMVSRSSLGNFIVHLKAALVTGTLDVANQKITSGIVAGRWPAKDALSEISRVRSLVPSVCIGTTISGILCSGRDILSNPADDGTLNECDAVSMAFGFTAAGATFADPPADGGGLSPKVCLGAYSATCP